MLLLTILALSSVTVCHGFLIPLSSDLVSPIKDLVKLPAEVSNGSGQLDGIARQYRGIIPKYILSTILTKLDDDTLLGSLLQSVDPTSQVSDAIRSCRTCATQSISTKRPDLNCFDDGRNTALDVVHTRLLGALQEHRDTLQDERLAAIRNILNFAQLSSVSPDAEKYFSHIKSLTQAYIQSHNSDGSSLNKVLADLLKLNPARRGRARSRRSLLPTGSSLPDTMQQKSIDNVMSQYQGILSPDTLHSVEKALSATGVISGIISDDSALSAIEASLDSVTAGLSGNSVTAFAQMQNCIEKSLQSPSNLISCYSTANGPASAMETALDNIVEQFSGYLTPNLVSSINNLISYHLSNVARDIPLAGALVPAWVQINNALGSIAASTGGNSATAVLQLQNCLNHAAAEGISSISASYSCFVDGPFTSLQTILNGIVQQAVGYLPPNSIMDLYTIVTSRHIPGNSGTYATELTKAFEASGAGPRSVTCFESLQTCMLQAAKSGHAVDCQSSLAASCTPMTLS